MSDKAEAAGIMVSKASAYASSGGLTLFAGLTAQEWAALVGIFLGIATFAVNWYYQRRRVQLQQRITDHKTKPEKKGDANDEEPRAR